MRIVISANLKLKLYYTILTTVMYTKEATRLSHNEVPSLIAYPEK